MIKIKTNTNNPCKTLWSITLFTFLLLQATNLMSQTRYLDEVFEDVKVTKDIRYSTAVPMPIKGGGFHETVTRLRLNVREDKLEEKDLLMNIYEPAGDELTNRPVIILCHGGAFVLGNKDFFDITAVAKRLAKLGYVTATISYRLGINIWSKTSATRTIYRSLQDGRSAVRFFRADAAGNNKYNINPNEVYIAGHSAGAFVSLYNGYLDKESERPAATRETTYRFGNKTYPIGDLGCLDCVGDNQEFDGKANAVVAMAGAMGSLEHIEGPSDVPTLMFHSEDDNIINYNEGLPFENFSFLFPNYTIPVAFGSNKVSQKASEMNAPNQLYSYPSRGHLVHYGVIPPGVYDDIIERTGKFLYDNRLRPTNLTINGPRVVDMSQSLSSTYYISDKGRTYNWEVNGGTVISQNGNSVTVNWEQEGEQRLRAIPSDQGKVKSSGISIPILVNDSLDDSNLRLYPNPVSTELKITIKKNVSSPYAVFVYDQQGRFIQKSDVQSTNSELAFPVDHLQNGVYYLRLINDKEVINKTFIKK